MALSTAKRQFPSDVNPLSAFDTLGSPGRDGLDG